MKRTHNATPVVPTATASAIAYGNEQRKLDLRNAMLAEQASRPSWALPKATAERTAQTAAPKGAKKSPRTPKGVDASYGSLLDCMKYSREGGLDKPDNAWHNEHFYCKAVEVRVVRDGKSFGLGRNPYEQFCYSVAKKWRVRCDWLPDRVRTPLECEEQEACVGRTLFECLERGDDRETLVNKCFDCLDEMYLDRKQDEHKTGVREERAWAPERAFVATLFSGDLSTVGGTEADLTDDCEFGSLTLEECEQLERLKALFDKVKEAHKFATPEKWLSAQCYALNMRNDDGVRIVYGKAVDEAKSEKAQKKALHSARVKYSRNASEVFGWILDEVENQPDGLEKWVDVLNRCKATAETTAMLEEYIVKLTLDDETVKSLRAELAATPERVKRFLEKRFLENPAFSICD